MEIPLWTEPVNASKTILQLSVIGMRSLLASPTRTSAGWALHSVWPKGVVLGIEFGTQPGILILRLLTLMPGRLIQALVPQYILWTTPTFIYIHDSPSMTPKVLGSSTEAKCNDGCYICPWRPTNPLVSRWFPDGRSTLSALLLPEIARGSTAGELIQSWLLTIIYYHISFLLLSFFPYHWSPIPYHQPTNQIRNRSLTS